MQYAINTLKSERERIVIELKNGHSERLGDLQQIDKAIGWLKLLMSRNVDKAVRYDFEQLPEIEGCVWSSYRLVADMETEDKTFWTECRKPDGSDYCITFGDYLLLHKP